MHSTPNGSGHEKSEVSVPFIVVSLSVLLVGTFLVALLVIGIFQFFSHTYQTQESAKQNQQQIPPEPRIEVEPFKQLLDVHAREDHVLSSYAWVDKGQGIVRIPIDQAIDDLAKKGLPTHDYLQDILRKQNAAK
ncbi:MAG TPA: hypothetical protein VGP62_25690 [Bryobacteraceae bacterium]|nr:hypothetical protein [Bryobacteraceae bacterium]